MNSDQSHRVNKRRYHMETRMAMAAETGQRIVSETVKLYTERWLEDLTLDEVATRAGVTVQTVLRRFGSKAGLIQAVGETLYHQVSSQRNQAPVGDIVGAVANLMDHYEAVGDVAIRTLAQEERHEALRAFAEQGRAFHRAWVEATFRPFLEGRSADSRSAMLTKLVVATDVYIWKLLRRDIGLERGQTEQYMADMVSALVEQSG